MASLLLTLVEIVLTWVLAVVLFFGIGFSVLRAFRLSCESFESRTIVPWVGFGAVIAVLQVWHLFFPVGPVALGIFAVWGAIGAVWYVRRSGMLLLPIARKFWPWGLLFLAFLFWLADHSATQPVVFDSGLYHLNAVKWSKAYAIVPGLGNLHGRLAFNNSSFLYSALLDTGWFENRSHQLATGVLVVFLFARLLRHLHCLFHQSRAEAWQVFDALMLAPLTVWIVNCGYISSPSPDACVFLLGVVLASELLRILFASVLSREEVLAGAFSITFLSVVGVSIKMNFVVAGLAASAVAFVIMCREVDRADRIRMMAQMGCAVVVVIAVWMFRGIILSGYPAYPCGAHFVTTDWQLPLDEVAAMKEVIIGWGREPSADWQHAVGNMNWIWKWLNRFLRQNFECIQPLSLSILACFLLWHSGRVNPKGVWLRICGFLVMPLSALVFWFLTAPEPRFAGSMFWVLGAGLTAVALWMRDVQVARAVVLTGLILLLLTGANIFDLVRPWQRNPGPARVVEMKKMVTDSGLAVYVPAAGQQPWNSPLPATPYFNPRLRLRDPADMSKGFTCRPLPVK